MLPSIFFFLLIVSAARKKMARYHHIGGLHSLPHSPIVEQAPSIAFLSKLGESHHAHMCV